MRSGENRAENGRKAKAGDNFKNVFRLVALARLLSFGKQICSASAGAIERVGAPERRPSFQLGETKFLNGPSF